MIYFLFIWVQLFSFFSTNYCLKNQCCKTGNSIFKGWLRIIIFYLSVVFIFLPSLSRMVCKILISISSFWLIDTKYFLVCPISKFIHFTNSRHTIFKNYFLSSFVSYILKSLIKPYQIKFIFSCVQQEHEDSLPVSQENGIIY